MDITFLSSVNLCYLKCFFMLETSRSPLCLIYSVTHHIFIVFSTGWLLAWNNTQHKSTNDENDICIANGWLEHQDQQFFLSGIYALEKRWNKEVSFLAHSVQFLDAWESWQFLPELELSLKFWPHLTQKFWTRSNQWMLWNTSRIAWRCPRSMIYS